MERPAPKTSTVKTCVYGPVPSRRLGFSLGVDIFDDKTCSLDCVYCQLGSTARTTVRRREWLDPETVLSQIRTAVEKGSRIDYITFSGSGEPTLHSRIGHLIREIKSFTDIPVAVLTNATLLTRARVRKSLLEADLVVPSLDAASQEAFARVNRPHESLRIEDIISGLIQFRGVFKGRIWLEILLVKGVNDSPADVEKLKSAIARISPDKIQLNTVVRPPAESSARPLSRAELEAIGARLTGPVEIIAEFKGQGEGRDERDPGPALLSALRRRPMTLSDLETSLGYHPLELLKALERLIRSGSVRVEEHKARRYYSSGPRKDGT